MPGRPRGLPRGNRSRLPRSKRIESVFQNIPCDDAFEDLYLAYIVGLTQLGLRINATLAVPHQGRLDTIVDRLNQIAGRRNRLRS